MGMSASSSPPSGLGTSTSCWVESSAVSASCVVSLSKTISKDMIYPAACTLRMGDVAGGGRDVRPQVEDMQHVLPRRHPRRGRHCDPVHAKHLHHQRPHVAARVPSTQGASPAQGAGHARQRSRTRRRDHPRHMPAVLANLDAVECRGH